MSMTTVPQSPFALSLPTDLADPLREVARRERAISAGVGIVRAVTVALLVLLMSSLLLGYVPLPLWLRLPFALLVWVAVVFFAARALQPALARRSLSGAARRIERSMPHLQERLSSAVELVVEEKNPAFRGSPELVGHLVRQVQSAIGHLDPAAIVPTKPIAQQAILLLPLCIAWLTLAFTSATTQPFLRGAYATLVPWAAHAPVMLATVQVSPGDVVIAAGDSLKLSAKISRRAANASRAAGATLVRRFSNGQALSQLMERATGDGFGLAIDDIRQSFSYRVLTDTGNSDWFAVTVHPRPAITQLVIHYDFPPYSGIASSDNPRSDGVIAALVGTRVTLTVRTESPILVEKSRIVLDEGKRNEQPVTLTAVAPTEYRAQFILNHSGDYHIRLNNAHGLGNIDDPARTIAAQFDQPPSATILSPVAPVTVRSDDVVPVEYRAADDFSVTSLQAVVQVDEGTEQAIKLPVTAGDHRDVSGTWSIDVPKILASVGLKNASRIGYYLKATDNRDPDPQTGSSAHQVLVLDPNQSRSYLDQLNEQRKRRVDDAIRKALERLRQVDWRSNNLKNLDEHHLLNPDERRDARELRELLISTSRDLSTASDEFLATPYAAIARLAKDIAEHPIADAADNIVKAEFSADVPVERQRSANAAHDQIVDAQRRLEKLLPAADEAQRKAEAAEALQQAARKQQETADEMTRRPQNVEDNRAKQRQAMDRLNDAMNKDPALREPQAQELAQKLSDLTQKIEEDQARQARLQDVVSRQQEEHAAKDAAQPLAELQRKLNGQLEKFRADNNDRLNKSGSNPPHKDQGERIVDHMTAGRLSPAVDEMKNVVNRLKEVSRKLKDAAGREKAGDDAESRRQRFEKASDQAIELAQTEDDLEKKLEPEAKRQRDARHPELPDEQVTNQQRELAKQTGELRQAAEQLADRTRQGRSAILTRRAQAAQKSLEQATAAQQKAAEASAAHDPARAGDDQGEAQQALAKADEALRGDLPRSAGDDAQKGEGAEASNPAPSQKPGDEANTGSEAASSSGGKGEASLAEASHEAAQASQEAAAAQRQAMRPNPSAAQQAASALARAADAAARATQANPDSGRSSGEQSSAGQSADASSSAKGQDPSATPGQTAQSRSGIRGQGTGGNNAPPAAVRDLGISAGDWAKLPPLMQQDLINASQQTGPPAYREMIRNYYVRIANLQSHERDSPANR